MLYHYIKGHELRLSETVANFISSAEEAGIEEDIRLGGLILEDCTKKAKCHNVERVSKKKKRK